MLGQMRLPRTEGTEASSRFLFFRDLINNIGGEASFFHPKYHHATRTETSGITFTPKFQPYEIKIYF